MSTMWRHAGTSWRRWSVSCAAVLAAFLLVFAGVARAADADLDPLFNASASVGKSAIVRGVLALSDGKLLVYGNFTSIGGVNRPGIARLNSDGTLDTTFVPPWDSTVAPFLRGDVRSVGLQADGKIILGGDFTAYITFSGDQRPHVCRLNTDGTIDAAFTQTLSDMGTVNAVDVQSNDRVLVGGAGLTLAGSSTPMGYNLLRLTAGGSLDATYPIQAGIGAYVRGIKVYPDDPTHPDKARVKGEFPNAGAPTDYVIWRDEDGDVLSTIGEGVVNGSIIAMATQTDGKNIYGGYFTQAGGLAAGRIARFNTNGTLDTGFAVGTGANGEVTGLNIQGDGKIVVAGGFTKFNGTSVPYIVRLLPGGAIDTTFAVGAGANDPIFSLTVGVSASMTLTGAFTSCGGYARGGIARIVSTGATGGVYASSGAANTNKGTVYASAVQPDGKIVIGGDFSRVNGRFAPRVARLNSDGALDPSFDVGRGPDGTIQTIALQPDGGVVIGGTFQAVAGYSRGSLARLGGTGDLDPTFRPFLLRYDLSPGNVYKVLRLASDSFMVGGHFRNVGGTAANYLVRLNPDGTLDAGFTNGITITDGVSNIVYSLADAGGGATYVGGYTTYQGLSRGYLTRVTQAGALDTTFTPASVSVNVAVFTGIVKRIIPTPDGAKVYICGNFNEMKDGSWSPPQLGGIARFASGGALDGTFATGMGFNAWVEDMALQKDGKVVAVGTFTRFNVPYVNDPDNALRVARILPTGAIDPAFPTATGFDDSAYTVSRVGQGRAFVGGKFTTYKGFPRAGVAMLVVGKDVTMPAGVIEWLTRGAP